MHLSNVIQPCEVLHGASVGLMRSLDVFNLAKPTYSLQQIPHVEPLLKQHAGRLFLLVWLASLQYA